ncbi:MAG: carbohydrate ABC transporter permease [Verrucomicrobia bacterium]|nr:carbohydrate ABC transporter permease [Verrucomicrobiota bacterium]
MRDSTRVGRLATYFVCVVGSALMLLPLAWLVRSSFMTPSQIFNFPPDWIPKPFTLQNYPDAFTSIPFFEYLRNTVFILVPSVLGTVVTATLGAYGFSRLRWRGRDLVFNILLTTLMLPYAITLIPTFLLWAHAGLVNTIWPLVIPRWFGGGIFYIFLLRQFFRTIPRDLDEAAILDGANRLQVLWFIIVPLSRPALFTVAIFSALNVWNDFLGPLLYLNDSRQYTLALGLAEFTGLYNSQWHLLMAASTAVVAPVLVLFLFAQKYFIEGITLTGAKT